MYDNWWFKIYMVAVFAIIVAYITWIIFHTQVKRTLDFQKKELEFVKKQLEMGNETVMTIARTVDAKDNKYKPAFIKSFRIFRAYSESIGLQRGRM